MSTEDWPQRPKRDMAKKIDYSLLDTQGTSDPTEIDITDSQGAIPKKVNVTQKSRRESVSDKLSDNFIEYERTNTGKMQKLESELDNLTEEESELIKIIEIEEKKNNIEFLKSRLAKLRIKDNKNAVLIDERENNISHPQFRRGLQNKQSARAVEVNTSSPIRGYITRPTLHAAFKKKSRTRHAVPTRRFIR